MLAPKKESRFGVIQFPFKTRANFLNILGGAIDPMQAMPTRKLIVDGDMIYMMRNVPVVLDFVRCAKSVGVAP